MLKSSYSRHNQESIAVDQVYKTELKPAPFILKTKEDSIQRLHTTNYRMDSSYVFKGGNNNYDSSNSSYAGGTLKINLDRVY
jgi:hypothetical protein